MRRPAALLGGPTEKVPRGGHGPLQQRSWTAEDGSARSVVEVVAEELGASLRWATATTTRTTRSQEQASYRVGQDVLTSVTLRRGSSGSRIWPSTAWRRARGIVGG